MHSRFLFLAALITGNCQAQTGNNSLSCGPIPAVCTPATLSGGLGHGIFQVILNQINNPSSNPPMLEDFTCTDSTWLTPDSSYNFYVMTGTVYEESVVAWIDYSNDGAFDPSELIYSDSALIQHHQAVYTVPSNVPHTNTPIRMRLGSDYTGMASLNGCGDAFYGQYEDYTIYFGLGTGMNEITRQFPFLIHPNPFSISARIVFESSSPAEDCMLEIFNAFGQLVTTIRVAKNDTEIRRNNLATGIYFYRLKSLDEEYLGYGRLAVQ